MYTSHKKEKEMEERKNIRKGNISEEETSYVVGEEPIAQFSYFYKMNICGQD